MFRKNTAAAGAALWLLACLIMIASCGSSGPGGLLESQNSSALGADGNAAIGMGLPALADLPAPPRVSSIAGPGWFQVPILEQGVFHSRGSNGLVVLQEDGVSIVTTSGVNFAIFGVAGFDGDNQPNAVLPELSQLDTEFYLGMSHYASNRWEVAGPFTAADEYEYRQVGTYTQPDQYVSEDGYHYLAVIVPHDPDLEKGEGLILSGLQLGVDGGDNAPAPPYTYEAAPGDAGLMLYWKQSTDHDDPDFAGYAVERAAWPSHDFSEVGPLSMNTWFFDDNIDIGDKYRYRIRVEDVNGNHAYGMTGLNSNFPGDNSPVALLDIPAGPLHGAQQVTFDMGGSFDPDGDEITEYRISFGSASMMPGIPDIIGADESVDVMLQPGCYNIRVQVTANGKSSFNYWQLKIYPAWENSTTQVSEPTPMEWRIQAPRSIYYPPTGEVVTFFDDLLAPGIGMMAEQPDGRRSFQRIPYAEDDVDWISEPVIWNDRVYVAVMGGFGTRLAWYDGSQTGWEIGFFPSSSYKHADLVVDGFGDLRICVLDEFNPGDWRIMSHDATAFTQSYEIMDLANSDGWFDVEWNDLQGTYDVIYTTVGSMHYEQSDEEGGVIDSDFVAAGIFDFVDLEIDPATGMPGLVMLSGGLYTYYEYDYGTGNWSGPEAIDNSAVNELWADFIFVDSDATVFFGMGPAGSNLYRRNGGSWDATPADWTLISGDHCSLTAWPDDSIHIIDGAIGGLGYILDMQPDNTHGTVDQIAPVSYEGQDLTAIYGNDGIHAYWRGDGVARHFIGSGDASSWSADVDMGSASATDIMVDRDGEVFLSHTLGNSSDLYQWIGGAWIIESAWTRWGQSHPFLASQNTSPGGQWFVHDNSVAPAQVRYLHDDNGVAIAPDFFDLDSPQIMEGSMLWTPGGIAAIATASDFGTEDGRVGFLSPDTMQFNQLFDGDTGLLFNDWTRGRKLEGANYATAGGPQVRSSFWAGFRSGGGTGSTRISGLQFNGEFSIDDIVPGEQFPQSGGSSGSLATVSAAQGWGITAIGLTSQFFGPGASLEWSNFGEFEELDLPAIDWASTSMHELAIGPDGRWHLLYRDMTDGGIHVISTT